MKEILISLLASFIYGCILAAMMVVILMIKNEVTFRNQKIIANAIYAYQMYLIDADLFDPNNIEVDFDDMEDYGSTFKRIWDWGYKRILPPEKFELIKPFIER